MLDVNGRGGVVAQCRRVGERHAQRRVALETPGQAKAEVKKLINRSWPGRRLETAC